MLFDRLLLMDLRQMISRFDAAGYTSLAQLTEPPPLILHVLKAVVVLVKPDPSAGVQLSEWSQCLSVCCLHSSNLPASDSWLAEWQLVGLDQRSYSTLGPVSAWMRDRLRVGKLSRHVTSNPGQWPSIRG